MRRARAFVAFLAACFLAWATRAHAGEVAGLADLANTSDAGTVTRQESRPDLESVTTEFGRMVAPDDDGISAIAGVQRVSDDEMSEQRGGFVYQGVDINFGAEIRSYIGNELVMQTNFNWTDVQANVEHTISTELAPAALAAVQAGMLNGAGLSMRVGNDNIYITNDGQTALVQRADGTLQNIILNSANNVVLRQEIDANLNLSNFAPFQNAAQTGRIVSALSNIASTALTMGGIR